MWRTPLLHLALRSSLAAILNVGDIVLQLPPFCSASGPFAPCGGHRRPSVRRSKQERRWPVAPHSPLSSSPFQPYGSRPAWYSSERVAASEPCTHSPPTQLSSMAQKEWEPLKRPGRATVSICLQCLAMEPSSHHLRLYSRPSCYCNLHWLRGRGEWGGGGRGVGGGRGGGAVRVR